MIVTYGNIRNHANLCLPNLTAIADPMNSKGRAYKMYLNLGVDPKYQEIGIENTAPKTISQIVFLYIPAHTRIKAVMIPGQPISNAANVDNNDIFYPSL